MVRKVLAYIVRQTQEEPELLVFRRLESKESCLEVPGGTVGAHERLEEALYRQIEEESGLVHFRFIGKLMRQHYRHPQKQQRQERHIFLLEPLEAAPDQWQHGVRSFGKDDGEALELFWLPVAKAQGRLAWDQDAALSRICEISLSETG